MLPADLRTLRADILACLAFYTRWPAGAGDAGGRGFAEAQWAAPVAGLAVALGGALAYWLAHSVGLPPSICGLLAVAATIFASGALHEDGLSDTADGLGGGRDRERKLEIMRDSRIGSYGAAALIFSILLRAAALAAIAAPGAVAVSLIAAHMAGRALMPLLMHLLPPARTDGLSAGVGAVPRRTAMAALLIGGVALLPLGLGVAIVTTALLLVCVYLFRHLCERQIGGQTGDVLGALEQAAEAVVLLVAASAFRP